VLLKDPLRLREFLIDRIAAAVPMKTYANDAAFISPDGSAILIRIRGRNPVSDIEFSKRLTAAVTRVAEHENSDGFQIGCAGGYAIAATSATAIRADMISSVIGSCVSLQLLFILAYRRPVRSFLFAFTPVALGVLLGFGLYALLSRGLSRRYFSMDSRASAVNSMPMDP